LVVDDARDDFLDLPAFVTVPGQEDQTDAVVAGRRQVEREVGRRPEEPVGDLNQDAGAVARVGLATAGAAMLEIPEDLDALADDVVRPASLEMDDEADAAGVLLVLGIVKALSLWDLPILHTRVLPRPPLPTPRAGTRRTVFYLCANCRAGWKYKGFIHAIRGMHGERQGRSFRLSIQVIWISGRPDRCLDTRSDTSTEGRRTPCRGGRCRMRRGRRPGGPSVPAPPATRGRGRGCRRAAR